MSLFTELMTLGQVRCVIEVLKKFMSSSHGLVLSFKDFTCLLQLGYFALLCAVFVFLIRLHMQRVKICPPPPKKTRIK